MGRKPGECYVCGASMRHIGKTREIGGNGHSNRVYYCENCDRKRVSG